MLDNIVLDKVVQVFYSSTIKWVLFSNIVSLTVNVTNTEDESFICILIKIMRDSHKRIIPA